MKKISYVLVALVLMFSTGLHAYEGRGHVAEMLKQVSDINSSWKPIIGQNIYVLRNYAPLTTVYILMFNSTKYAGGVDEPEVDDVRVVFSVKGNKVKLLFIDFYAGKDLLIQNMGLIFPSNDKRSK